ncbi:MAG: YdgA family protein [Burkholderiaceae bacterium]|nr:YdgA family protein [Burkholderiaceae bacterium]
MPLTVVVVLIAVWVGATWYTGTRIEAQTGDIIARVNTAWAGNQQPMGMQIKQISYMRGFFSSHARFALTNNLLQNQSVVEYDVTFSHGPFPLAALLRGYFLPRKYQAHVEVLPTTGPFKAMADALMNGKPPLVIDVGCSYDNHCTGTGSVPPIDADLDPVSKSAKLAFGGVQMQFDFDRQSDNDYQASGDAQLLPLSIGGQNFGSGQITVMGDAHSATEVFSWKTDQGASKLTLALNATRPIPLWSDPALTPEDWPKLFKTVSAKLELSKSMAVDLAAHALSLTKGIDPAATRQQMNTRFDTVLTNNAEAREFIQAQGDLLVSDWQYADGKLTVNGQEHPELLEQIKQNYQARLHVREQAAAGAAAQTPGDAVASAASASAPVPASAASGQ